MTCDSEKRHRRSLRLKGYDYSQAGAYFITVCTQNRKCLFGNIVDGEMRLNGAGQMVAKWYRHVENKFQDIHCDEFICMPNHVHFIVMNVGADLRVCPIRTGEYTRTGEHIGSPLHRVVQWFKTMTTNEYIQNVKNNGWRPFHEKLWQRNYYEHVVRSEESLNRIRQYVIDNPARWAFFDRDNPDAKTPEPENAWQA